MNDQVLFYKQFEAYLAKQDSHHQLLEAMNYSFNSNGKLIRPKLFWAMLKDLNISEDYIQVAMAIEMIHTYSLVHDDLPAMDNDDYRRGKLTCHKVYGEDMAILTGDGLLTEAFNLLTMANLDADKLIKIISSVASASGVSGMIGGQVKDVKNELNSELSLEMLKEIHNQKTGMLIELPIKCAGIIAGAENDELLRGARLLGLLYQIQDDYLDTYGDANKMGKAVGADAKKRTYSSFYTKLELEKLIHSMADEINQIYSEYPNTRLLINTIVGREG